MISIWCCSIWQIYNYQTAHTASTTAGTTPLTTANIINVIYQIRQTTTVLSTLPTGTLTHAGTIGGSSNNTAIGQSIDWSVINSGSSRGTATVQTSIAHTLVGPGIVAIGVCARVRTRLHATNVAITYRIY